MRPYSMLLAAALLLLPALAGCGSSPPTRLYVLSADAEKSDQGSAQGIAIGVGPVTLPKYLDRPQMVTRIAGNSLAQADLDQWGGDLNDNITRVLATNLANLLGTDRVSLFPWKDRAPIAYQVTLDVTRFEQDTDGGTVLDVFWSLVNPNTGKVVVMRRSSYRNPATTVASVSSTSAGGARTYDATAGAMSRDLEALSRDIAAAIRGQAKS